ncbi:MAG: hypothetical protein ACYC7E_10225 [Armatimonadota bacterium]
MSPKAILSIVIWTCCLGGLFLGLLLWGNHVERRDRERRFSMTPILQRGDLPEEYRILPVLQEEGQSILSSIIRSTGTRDFAQLDVELRPPQNLRTQVLYMLYPSPGAASRAIGEWQRLLRLTGAKSAPPLEPIIDGHDSCTALWQHEQMLIIIKAPNSSEAQSAVRAIAQVADARLQRWLSDTSQNHTSIPQ